MSKSLRIVSASAMARVIACPAHLRLPGEDVPAGPSAKRGIAMHTFIREAITGSRADALQSSTHKAPCSRLDLGAIRGVIGTDTAHWELAFEYDVASDRAGVVFPDTERNYEHKPGHVYGTCDLLIERSSGLELYDIKSGMDVGNPRTNWQLLTYALMASRTYKVDELRVGLLYVSPITGAVEIADAQLTALDLDDARDQIRLALAAIDDAPVVSDACRYCPAKAACPAQSVAA